MELTWHPLPQQTFQGTHLKSFQGLCLTYHLSHTDFYKYLQVRHILSLVKWNNDAVAGDLIQLLNNPLPKSFHLSAFYALLQKPMKQNKTSSMEFYPARITFQNIYFTMTRYNQETSSSIQMYITLGIG